MRTGITEFADIMDSHHKSVVIDKLSESGRSDYLEKRGALGNLHILHPEDGAGNPFERTAGIQCRHVRVGILIPFSGIAITVER